MQLVRFKPTFRPKDYAAAAHTNLFSETSNSQHTLKQAISAVFRYANKMSYQEPDCKSCVNRFKLLS